MTSWEAILFNPDPQAYLPHRPPFLFVDVITALEPGASATGDYAVTSDGYFPPVFLVEAMAQVGGIAAGQQEGEGGVLAALRDVKLPESVARKARITIKCSVAKSFGRLIQVEGEAFHDSNVIASATLTLAIGTP